ncbi:hypothetical protein [Noviluteimonas dokdonensis]|nr:hypothetical protein [Lysobacter dokdonensis]
MAMGMAAAIALPALCANIDANEYQKRLKVYQTIEPLGATPLGESINLYTGEASFSNVDIRLEGTGPTIEIVRQFRRGDPAETQEQVPNGFGDWVLVIPNIETLTPGREGWQVGETTPSNARCTQFGPMYSPEQGVYPRYGGVDLDKWWRGYQLTTPDGGKQELLKRAPSNLRKPATGNYPAVTYTQWQVGCLDTIQGGASGDEAFVALAPDGTRYWLDKLAYSTYQGMAYMDGGDKAGTYVLTRRVGRLYATQVQDRFGNSLTYSWTGDQLTRIHASDGRHVVIEWAPATNLIQAIKVMPGTPVERTWTYTYANNRLTQLTLPDASYWAFNLSASMGAPLLPYNVLGCFNANPAPGGDGSGTGSSPTGQVDATATIRHPSGLIGTFNFARRLHAQSSVPSYCPNDPGEVNETGNPYFVSMALVDKTLSGPGLTNQTWRYDYEIPRASLDRYCPTPTSCPTTAYVDVTDPANAVTRYTYSTRFDTLEGQLLRVDYNLVNGVATKTDLTEYYTPYGLRPTAFPDGGTFGGGNWYKVDGLTPARKRTTLLQGRAFVWEVPDTCGANGQGSGTLPCFDAYRRPTKITKSSAPAP